MPFQSKAQMRFMFAKHPKIAKRWKKKTKNAKALPEHKGKPVMKALTKRGGRKR